jgi:hypothetical protein
MSAPNDNPACTAGFDRRSDMSATQAADITTACVLKPATCCLAPYSVTTGACRPAKYVLRFTTERSWLVEVYREVAAAVIRTDDLRHGIESAQWIVADRVLQATEFGKLVTTTPTIDFNE